MFCSQCGAQQPDDSIFCDRCGARLEAPMDFDQSLEQGTDFAQPPMENPYPVTPPTTPMENPSPVTPPTTPMASPRPVTPPPPPMASPRPVTPPPTPMASPRPVTPPPPRPNTGFQQPSQTQQNQSRNNTTTVIQEPSSNSNAMIAGVVVAAVLLGGGYLAYPHISSMFQKDSATQTETSVPSTQYTVPSIDNSNNNSNTTTQDNTSVVPEPEILVPATKELSVQIQQVDSSNFPTVKVFAAVTDNSGTAVTEISPTDLTVEEIFSNGSAQSVQINSATAVEVGETAMNLVIDVSSSMEYNDKFQQSVDGLNSFFSYLSTKNSDSHMRAELTMFDGFVYTAQSFHTDMTALQTGLSRVSIGVGSAIYDAAYSALIQTNNQSGTKMVVLITDSNDSDPYESNYGYEEVVTLSQNTGIPVHIISVDNGQSQTAMENFASDCGGSFSVIEASALSDKLEELYLGSQGQFVFEFTSTSSDSLQDARSLKFSGSDSANVAESNFSYVPTADISGGFQSDYASVDYILPNSQHTNVSVAELEELSLAELRIARNEIYARHGRQFADSLLNEWFYSKDWYLQIYPKYSPTSFNQSLSAVELENIEAIKERENWITNYELIYPYADSVLLAEYDLTLTDEVLERALSQLNNLEQTDILAQNRQIIETKLNS